MAEITEITEDSYKVRLTYKCNELERESLTFRLKNTLQLLLEGGTEKLEEATGVYANAGEAGYDANTEVAPAKGDDRPSAPETE